MMMMMMLGVVVQGARMVKEENGKMKLHEELKKALPELGRKLQQVTTFDPSLETIAITTYDELVEAVADVQVATTVEILRDVEILEPIVIGSDATVYLKGPATLTATKQHFQIFGKASVENMVLTGGFAVNGGSILVDNGGSLRISNASFINNRAGDLPNLTPTVSPAPSMLPTPVPTPLDAGPVVPPISEDPRPFPGSGDGGAIAVLNGSSLEVLDGYFSGNGAVRMGGAIVAETSSIVSIESSIFEDNVAFVSNIKNIPFGGGAIAATDGSTLDIQGSSFRRNEAQISGGAIYSLSNARLSIGNSIFDGNAVNPLAEEESGGGRNLHYGGAVGALSTRDVFITGSTFENHTWMQPVFSFQLGATIGISFAQTLTIDGCTFANNGMKNFEGGTTLVEEGFFFVEGGGLYVDGTADITVSNSIFRNNSAEFGGALQLWSNCATFSFTPVVAEIKNCEFLDNRAIGYGGGVSTFGQQSSANISSSVFVGNYAGFGAGASLYCGVAQDFYVTDVTFEKNRAHQAGAAAIVSAGARATFFNVDATNNAADVTDPNYFQGSQADGGAIEVVAAKFQAGDPRSDDLRFSFLGTRLANNTAPLGGGGALLAETGILGGRFDLSSDHPPLNYTVYLDSETSIQGNTANGNGGGLLLKSGNAPNVVLLNGSTVVGNVPDDIHSNETGLVQGTLATLTFAVLNGNLNLFDLTST